VKRVRAGAGTAAVLALALAAFGMSSEGLSLPVLEAAGAGELRAAAYEAALAALDTAGAARDSCYFHLKRGLASFHTARYSQANASLLKVAASCPELAACAYESVAQVELALQRPANALTAYRSALSAPAPQRYHTILQKQVTDLIQERGIDPAGLAWLGPWFRPAPPGIDSAQRSVVSEFVEARLWGSLDSLVEIALNSDARKEACGLLARIPLDSIPDTAVGTKRLFEAAAALRSCGSARVAKAWLDRAWSREDFPRVVNEARAVYLRGMLSYALGDNDDALKWLRRYERENAPLPEVIITIARAYRAQGRVAKAGEWYDKHVRLFPASSQSHEILWYRAWQREEDGQLKTAIALYRRIRQQYASGPRAAESFFREGLLYLRTGRPDSALQVWSSLLKSYSQSSVATAAQYWRARALLQLNRGAEARESLRTVAQDDPLDYYSYRARDFLRELGDTLTAVPSPGSSDHEWARSWLDSISAPKPLSSEDSANYRTGVVMAAVGLGRQAECYLEPLLLGYTSNLSLQFDLASLLAFCDMPTLSYRAARPLAWRIPQQYRRDIPASVLAVLYPKAFADLIDQAAEQFAVEPNLLRAIIRQESVFDPQIASPAGAIGLMQIMPFTGEDLARQLGEPFAPESLLNAATNVRFGSYYVRSLLDRFDGNIVLVLAGYNGGPHNAKRWYEANSTTDFDTFVENISYTETRGYVKRVLANYWTYNRMARQELAELTSQ